MGGSKPTSFKNTAQNATPDNVLNFIGEILYLFVPDSEELECGDREEILNYLLSCFLENNARKVDKPFKFMSDCPNKITKHKVDICVSGFHSANHFLTVECKRLPAPKKSKNDTVREKEYVYCENNLGAIDRFRLNKHGIDLFGALLRKNAIIAYIEKENYIFWFNQINQWIKELENQNISDLIWSEKDLLILVSFDKIAKLQSNHDRVDGINMVELTHFWIYMNEDLTIH